MYIFQEEKELSGQTLDVGPSDRLWRPSDEAYRRAGRTPPSIYELRAAARVRVVADQKLKRRTPDWILAWAKDGTSR